MQRLYWLELLGILTGFVMVINGLYVIGTLFMIATSAIIAMFTKRFMVLRFLFYALILFLLMQFLAGSGGLDTTYAGFDTFLAFVSINLALFYEFLASKRYLQAALRPYLFAFIALITFTFLAILAAESHALMAAYPFGIFSLLMLINLIFMPYLFCLTLSFIDHEYNKVR